MNDAPNPNLPALQSGGSVRAIVPQNFEETWRIANAVSIAGMAPRGLDTPEKAMVAIMHGAELGLPPMMSLQSIAVINGRPSVWGDAALALVQASGKMTAFKEWFEGTGDARVAFCQVTRKGDGEPKLGKFSVTDAKTAQLWGKKGRSGEPTPWITYPDRMMKLRARGFALRDGFADVLRGLAIAEEQQDVAGEYLPEGGQMRAPAPRAPMPPAPPPQMSKAETASAATKVANGEMSVNTAREEAGFRPFEDDQTQTNADAGEVNTVQDAVVEEIHEEPDDNAYFSELETDLALVNDMETLEEVMVRAAPGERFKDETNLGIVAAIRRRAEKRIKAIK